MSDLQRLIIVLTIISIVAALALAQVYDLTKEPIQEQRRLAVLRSLKSVLPPFDNEIDKDTRDKVIGKDKKGRDIKILFYEGKKGEMSVGRAFKVVAKDGYGGDIEIMMGVDTEGKITGIEILNHKETPGLGDKITREPWRNQFKGKSLTDKLSVKKDGGDIDQFTGATISPRAVVKTVKEGLELYKREYQSGIAQRF